MPLRHPQACCRAEQYKRRGAGTSLSFAEPGGMDVWIKHLNEHKTRQHSCPSSAIILDGMDVIMDRCVDVLFRAWSIGRIMKRNPACCSRGTRCGPDHCSPSKPGVNISLISRESGSQITILMNSLRYRRKGYVREERSPSKLEHRHRVPRADQPVSENFIVCLHK
jgi:hypothetical protein